MDPHQEVEALLAGNDPVNPNEYSDAVREIVHHLFTQMARGRLRPEQADRLERLAERVRRFERRRSELQQRLGALNARRFEGTQLERDVLDYHLNLYRDTDAVVAESRSERFKTQEQPTPVPPPNPERLNALRENLRRLHEVTVDDLTALPQDDSVDAADIYADEVGDTDDDYSDLYVDDDVLGDILADGPPPAPPIEPIAFPGSATASGGLGLNLPRSDGNDGPQDV